MRTQFHFAYSAYHFLLAAFGALIYGFPSRKLTVIGVTGTKGKSTTVELINAVLEEAGFVTALSSTVRFKIGNESRPNTYKMTMPGRFFLQSFLHKAVAAGCRYVVLEMTSEGAAQFRHRFIELNALVITNIAPEHIEAHGSYENYLTAKRSIALQLARSHKERRAVIVNGDDKEKETFLSISVPKKYQYSLADAGAYILRNNGSSFTAGGVTITSSLPGVFNIYNMLAAITVTKSEDIPMQIIQKALQSFRGVPGRMERVERGQDFSVIVDYAHTVESLENVYGVFPDTRKICVLGATGGGRDKWKRPEMGAVVERFCDEIILTNEDPYDEDPRSITEDIARGITKKQYDIIMDRREAIAQALSRARAGDAVLITGKGTDPCICGPSGTREPWSDARVAEEELDALVTAQAPRTV